MPPKLYTYDLSPPARAAMMACEVFDVPVQMISLNFLWKDQMKPEYLKKNPLHTVPIFEDGDLIIHDSHAILMYLADTYGDDDDLYPKDVKQRALVNQILFFETGVLFPRLRDITMPPKLYTYDLSPPARAAMMACEVFDVPVQMISLNFLWKDQMKPEYLKKNPLHTVPIFEDGDLIIHDSHAILMYLADTYGDDDDLYPKDVKQRALVNQILFFETGVLFPRLRDITYPALMEGKTKVSKMQMERMGETYGYVEQFLTRSEYIATNNLTIADISVIATLSSMIELLPLDSEKYPKTRAWIDIMEQQNFYRVYNESAVAEFGSYFRFALGHF